MLLPILLFGTLWFWVAIAVFSVALITFVQLEWGGFSFFTLVAALVLYGCLGDKNIIHSAATHPLTVVEYIAGYAAIGILWGIVKWFFFVLKKRDEYETLRKQWITNNAPITDANRDVFKQYISTRWDMPKAAKNKGRIIYWMSYWPWSAVWTIIHDPVVRFYNFVYHRMADLFDAISKAMFGKYQNEM